MSFSLSYPKSPSKKPYISPTFSALNCEQAVLFLLGHAWEGNQNAKTLLELSAGTLFPPPIEEK
jgi:hypothetical protein